MIIIDKNRSNLSKNYRLERNKQSFIIVLTGSEERHKHARVIAVVLIFICSSASLPLFQHEQPEKRLARHGSGAKNDDLQEAGGQSSQNQERYRSS